MMIDEKGRTEKEEDKLIKAETQNDPNSIMLNTYRYLNTFNCVCILSLHTVYVLVFVSIRKIVRYIFGSIKVLH